MTKSRNTVTEKTVPISPAVLALVKFACNGYIPADFGAAWAQVPALVAQLAAGEGDSNQGVTISRIVEQSFARRVERSRRGEDRHERLLSEASDLIEKFDADASTEIEVAYTDAAFSAGLAVACYLLTTPAAIAINADGVR